VRHARIIAVVALAAALSAAAVAPAGAQSADTLTVSDKGVTKPPGTGLGTKAALDNPKCNPNTVQGWGTFTMITADGGPFCVAPAPADNGGSTSRGVTADTIKVVVVTPSPQSTQAAGSSGGSNLNRATGEPPTPKAAILDMWSALSHVYETWGRDVEFVFIESSGLDEASQRADAVKVAEEKPMFVLDLDSRGLETLSTTLAQQKVVVYSYSTTPDAARALAPYLWGLFDSNANAANAAEFIDKQVVGGKAEHAGDESLQRKARTFGLVHPQDYDADAFLTRFDQSGGKLATPALTYPWNGAPLGDPTSAQEQAPTVISKLKAAGVTSVILFTDVAMTGALTKAAAKQEFSPEWILTGFQYQDIAFLARNYDQEEFDHAFGISNLSPWAVRPGNQRPPSLIDWYWGPTQGSVATVTQDRANWLAQAIHYSGPTLTPKNVQRGLFSVPARGGAASDDPLTTQVGRGFTSGLKQPSYFNLGHDYAPVWYDADSQGPSAGLDAVGQGVTWYVEGGARYQAGDWPEKPLPFFDKKGAVASIEVDSAAAGTVLPCTGCPSEGGAGTPSQA
jgi:hypothetical protein